MIKTSTENEIKMKVEIATASHEKILGIKTAILRFFKIQESEVEIHYQKVKSEVPRQPFMKEIYQGALNRVNTIRHTGGDADFYISCEAGIEVCMRNFFNVQVICIFDKKNHRYLWGKSAGWQIPTRDIGMVKKYGVNEYLRKKGIRKNNELLGKNYSRAEAVAQATEMALASAKLN